MAQRNTRDIIVIGASMGGVEALSELVAQLPEDLPAAVCIVLHVAADHRSFLPEILTRIGPLRASHPQDHEPLLHGHIYVAPNDRHLLVEPGHVRVVKGPLENGHRPAVDPLFRSAARAYGPRVVGVVLTGALNCGTAGLLAVKNQGGLAVVQDPDDAACPDMPRSAMEYVEVDHSVPLRAMGALLGKLVRSPARMKRKRPVSRLLDQEVKVMAGHPEATNQPPAGGNPSHFACPDCGGVLFEMDDTGMLRYRCRVGHGYTAESLIHEQVTHVDSAMWAAVRALEENAALARRLAAQAREREHLHSARRYETRAETAEHQARVLRGLAMRTASVDAQLPSPVPAEDDVREKSG
ncbi:chemotaxis protein CheB [Hyalangium rubrum]|uniref:protein-glutamate methylesterase n=1 Tax=Hyalangium rubrum TaxID=3103134 RepID=A0ABU5GYA6_9BACT|nr:chemotaxis protein CheB [Hyalangium sp. s54d21]MDY7225847.1 chemotaxis protein CheB [Hyalangium sp. s54d21]